MPTYYRSHDWPVYVLCALPLVGGLLLLAAELPARLLGGTWLPLTASDWLERATSSLRHPSDPAGAWPHGSGAPGPVAYWSTLALLLVVVVGCVLLVRHRRRAGSERGQRRRRRPGFASARDVRAALDGGEAGRIATISVSLPVMRTRPGRGEPSASATPGDEGGHR